jgi:DNA-binding GntR family transcriptional regulator
MIKPRTGRPALETVKGKLRELSLAAKVGMLIDSEEALIKKLGASRNTLRQAARLLEHEGFLRVRRGIGGGFFSVRPDEKTIQTVVSAYLDTLELPYEDVTVVASALWVVVLRRAAGMKSDTARKLAVALRERVLALDPKATFHDVVEVEQTTREAIFDLVKSRYIQMIFHINEAFSVGRFPLADKRDGTAQHHQFVRAWREAKLLELQAIEQGDGDLGAFAARKTRNIWHERFWSKGR